MRVQLQLFAVAQQLAATPRIELELPDGATVADLRRCLGERVPALEPMLKHLAFAIGTNYAEDDTVIPPEQPLACIPPVSGG